MYPFPSINQFRNVINHVRQQARFMGLDEHGEAIMNPAPVFPTLAFIGTVKLHGTNAAIVFHPDQTITFQSRERVLTPGKDSDNAGFAGHFSEHLPELWFQLVHLIGTSHVPDQTPIAIYGEWCGGSIQKGVAINGLPKMFVVFAIKVNEEWRNDLVHTIRDPEIGIYNIEQFPKWFMNIDFEKPELSQELLSKLTMAVEESCPVGKHFGQEGIGEGIVWKCVEHPSSDYWFKVKGEKHSASKVNTLAPVDVEAIENIRAFVYMAVTEARLEQGLQNLQNEQQKPFAMTSLGDFIKWVHNDVMKEEADTIVANGFDHKQLGSPIALISKRWFIEKLNQQAMA
jgi:hypothetical protein